MVLDEEIFMKVKKGQSFGGIIDLVWTVKYSECGMQNFSIGRNEFLFFLKGEEIHL